MSKISLLINHLCLHDINNLLVENPSTIFEVNSGVAEIVLIEVLENGRM